MADLYGGVETGGTWCVCALGSGPGALVQRATFATGPPAPTLERIADFFSGAARPVALGVGAFGPLDLDRSSPTWGHVTNTPKPGWRGASVAGALGERLGVPVAFDTDVAAAAIGEQRWGAGRGAPTLVYLTVGTGIGAGLLIDGRPHHGLIHPEVGHLRVPHDRERDPFDGVCPWHGDCWEGLATGPALAQRWGAPPEQLPEDHPAWTLQAEYVALGLVSLVSVFSPHRVIVGGGVMARPALLEMVRERLVARLGGYLDSPLLGPRIDDYVVAPALGDDAGVLGAIAMAQTLGD